MRGKRAALFRALVALSFAGCQVFSGATEREFVAPAGGSGAGGGGGGVGGEGGGSGAAGSGPRDKVDLLLVVDNSGSMGEKQRLLASVVEEMINRLLYPLCIDEQGTPQPWEPRDCPAGTTPDFPPLKDLHIGVVTGSLGGHGSDFCAAASDRNKPGQSFSCSSAASANFTCNDKGHLITRGERTDELDLASFPEVQTWGDSGFLVWAPGATLEPPGDTEQELKAKARSLVLGADRIGCGYQAPLEAWYRFLVDPTPSEYPIPPPAVLGQMPAVVGVDKVLLAQRKAFLRKDSLVGIVLISDANDCSIIDGSLPKDVCDTPTMEKPDDNGIPVGCAGGRRGWPAGYVEGNFEDITTDAEGRVTGTPFPANYLVAQQKNGSNPFRLRSGTSACASDPYSPACRSCYLSGGDCADLTSETDSPQLRCWNQKQRFGFDALYPLRRYIDGLRNPRVYDREGYLVLNPLFSGVRTEKDIFLATIVGVPWQDIARDPKDLTKGYKPTVATPEAPGVEVDWDLILGDPFNQDPAQRRGPIDPLMIETYEPRGGTHPVTQEIIDSTTWNSVNGHEWNPGKLDLQRACIFTLPPEDFLDCSMVSRVCDCAENDTKTLLAEQNNPLCEGLTADGKGDGVPTTVQRRARAYPAPRVLQVVKGIGAQGILTSICTPNTTNVGLSSYAYRPATKAIAEAISLRLKGP